MKTNICSPKWCCAGAAGAANDCCDDADSQFDRPIIQPLVADAPAPVTITKSTTSGTSSPNESSDSNCVDSSTAIGLGAALGTALLIALCVIAWLVLVMKKRASRDKTVQLKEPVMQSNNHSYSQGAGYEWSETIAAKHRSYIAEAPGNPRRFEIPG